MNIVNQEKVRIQGRNVIAIKKSNERKFLTDVLCNYLDYFVTQSLEDGPIDVRSHFITLFSIAISLNAKEILEIGTRAGFSTIALNSAIGLTKGRLTSVDIKVPAIYYQLPFPKNWTFVHSDSIAFLKSLEDNKKFDIVFIDGNHVYKQVKQELELISNHVEKNSLILLHDTMPGSCPEYSNGKNAHPTGFMGGGPYVPVSELDKNKWEFSTIPVSHGLTILRKLKC